MKKTRKLKRVLSFGMAAVMAAAVSRREGHEGRGAQQRRRKYQGGQKRQGAQPFVHVRHSFSKLMIVLIGFTQQIGICRVAEQSRSAL